MGTADSITARRPRSHGAMAPLRSPHRFLLAAAAAAAAVAHIPVTGPHLQEAPYMGALFVVLTVALLVLVAGALVWDIAEVYLLTALTCALAILGYAATRTFAFPLLADDVGNWLEPLGIVSVLTEAVALVAAMTVLRRVRPSSDW
jgi:hypothetical protein